ncbi:unnamed protein product, partial [Oppiella nova]
MDTIADNCPQVRCLSMSDVYCISAANEWTQCVRNLGKKLRLKSLSINGVHVLAHNCGYFYHSYIYHNGSRQKGPMSLAPVDNPVAHCPPGLEYLLTVDQLLVHQKIELLENTDCCTRQLCGPIRPFDLKILDNNRREVIHLYRPLRCDGCCCWCCLQRLDVLSPCGEILGTIRQEWSLCLPKFRVEDANGECVLMIR